MLNAHFVESEALSTVQFQHEAVSVVVATDTKPDGVFAAITCAGVTTVDEDEELNAAGAGIAWTRRVWSCCQISVTSDTREQ